MELLELLVMPVVEIVGELLLTLLGQLFGTLGSHTLAAYRKPKPKRPWLSAFSHFVVGGLLGLVSIGIFDHSLTTSPAARLAMAIASPVLAGGATALVGMRRRKGGLPTVMIENFSYGFLFAAAFSAVRYLALR